MSSKKIAYIDSLRGVAILMVVTTHVGAEIASGLFTGVAAYGRMGVQLFFVMSALTLCMSLENRLNESAWVAKYFLRRYFRIAPVYYLGAILYLLIDIFVRQRFDAEFKDYIFHFAFLHAFFPDSFMKVVPGGWSIGVEFAFYFVFPLLYLYFCRGSLARVSSLFIMAIVLSTLNYLYLVNLKGYGNGLWDYPYWSFLNNFPVFCAGLLLYAINANEKIAHVVSRGSIVGFACFSLISMIFWKSGGGLAVVAVPVVSSISFVFLYYVFRTVKWLNFEWLQRVGQVSFSVYVFHFAIISFVSFCLREYFSILAGDVLFMVMYVLVVAAVFCVAVMSERYIEKPFVRFAARITSQRPSAVQVGR